MPIPQSEAELSDVLKTWGPEGEMYFRLYEPLLGVLDLTCENGYVVNSYDLGFPAPREVVFTNSLDSGTFDLTRYHGNRSVNLQITLRATRGINGTGELIASEAQLRDWLMSFLAPSRRAQLIFSEHQDFRIRRMQLRGSAAGSEFSRPLGNKMSCTWIVPYGMIESWELHTARAVLNEGTTDATVPLVNVGTVPAHWQATIEGDVTNPTLTYTDPLNIVSKLQLLYDSNPGDVVVIDSFTKTVTVNGKPVGYKFVADSSVWFRIMPGEGSLTLTYPGVARKGYPWGIWQPDAEGTNWAIPPGTTPPNNPAPAGAPPWAWATNIDPETGEPGTAEVTITWRDVWV